MTSDRKTSSSNSRLRPTTTAANGSSEALSRLDTSMLTAVVPVTDIAAPVSFLIVGARERISSTSRFVASASGALVGTSWISALPVLLLYSGRETATTPGCLCSSPATRAASRCPPLPPPVSARISNGPLKP
jgi:hypothetical protein